MAGILASQSEVPIAGRRAGFRTCQALLGSGLRPMVGQDPARGIFRHPQRRGHITTVLGSCIAACIRDPATRIGGGMNHFMLPEDGSPGKSSWIEGPGGLATRYGSYAMESLINELMKLGARRDRLEVKLFGGGRILSSMTDVGQKNITFAKDFLKMEGFKIVAEDVGDVYPRRVLYFPTTGVVMLKRLRALDVSRRSRSAKATISTVWPPSPRATTSSCSTRDSRKTMAKRTEGRFRVGKQRSSGS